MEDGEPLGPDDMAKELVIFDGAGHGIGFEGGIPEAGLGAYGDVLQGFLVENAPSCVSL